MFRFGSSVEEIATGRRGIVGISGSLGKPSNVTVLFNDGEEPLLKDFKDTIDLRLIETPGAPELPAKDRIA